MNASTSNFIPSDMVGSRSDIIPSTVAYLVERTPDGTSFNWTSVLNYTPDPSVRGSVPVSCSGGSIPCRDTTLVIGKSLPLVGNRASVIS